MGGRTGAACRRNPKWEGCRNAIRTGDGGIARAATMKLVMTLLIFFCLSAAPATAPLDSNLSLVPESYRSAVAASLKLAGPNRAQWLAAIERVPESQRTGLAFLLANMPARDLESLKADEILE